MNVALRPLPGNDRTTPAAASRIARIEIFDDLTAAEPHWRRLERETTLTTRYQHFDFLSLWQRHIGAAAGVTPFIVIGFDANGSPLLLWPFGRRALGPFCVAEFLGGKHANFNMALWRRDLAASIGADAIHGVLAQLAGQTDALVLVNQPLTWGGTTNPFALLPHQRAANAGFSGTLVPDFDTLLRSHTNAAARKKMRKKERALVSLGEVRFERAVEPNEIRRVLDAFFKQKSARMQARGIANAFAAPGVRRFVEAAAERHIGGDPLIELYALSVDDIIVATMGGIVGGGRFSAMFNSIIQGRFAIESPGEQLILNLVRTCCERGLKTFDLGIGEAHYKNLFCSDAEPLFDNYLPLSTAGRLLVWPAAKAAAIKRTIKQSPALWSLVRSLRCLHARASEIS
jgi:CelD/BcsL family acetyltransferase involved in cellulose biosynthesis